MTRRPCGAYIELNWFHGELLPSLAHIAAQADIDLDFFVLRENLASDPLGGIAIDGRVVAIDVADPHQPCAEPTGLEHHWTKPNYDFVIIGTAEPADRIRFALDIALPKLLVTHNPAPRLPELPDVCWVVLTDELASRHPGAMCLRPWFAGEPEPTTAAEHRFAVVGNVQMHRRNYGSLLRALTTLRESGVPPAECDVRIIGRWSDAHLPEGLRLGLEGERFFAAATRAGVADFLTLESECELSHPQLRAALASCRYALPLIDDCYLPARPYLAGKASGGLNQAIALGTIPVINERFAQTFGIRGGHTYRLDDVATGMRRALDGDDDDLIVELAEVRREGLAQSAESLREWVERL